MNLFIAQHKLVRRALAATRALDQQNDVSVRLFHDLVHTVKTARSNANLRT